MRGGEAGFSGSCARGRDGLDWGQRRSLDLVRVPRPDSRGARRESKLQGASGGPRVERDLERSREVRTREATERGEVSVTFLCARPHLRAMGTADRRHQVCLHSAERVADVSGDWCLHDWPVTPTTEGT